MFRNLKGFVTENFDVIVIGGIFTAAIAAVVALAAAEAKANAEENRQAIASGKTVIELFGQKAIF